MNDGTNRVVWIALPEHKEFASHYFIPPHFPTPFLRDGDGDQAVVFTAFNTAEASTTTRINAVDLPPTSLWAQAMTLTLHWMLRNGATNR